jgi:ribosome-associated protein
MHIRITSGISIPLNEIEITSIRSRGPGGQHVNKASTAVQLRFDVEASSLPADLKTRVRLLDDRRIGADGTIVITAREHRSQPRNRQAAITRLVQILRRAAHRPRPRIPTKPSRAVIRRRREEKKRRSSVKSLRGRVRD